MKDRTFDRIPNTPATVSWMVWGGLNWLWWVATGH